MQKFLFISAKCSEFANQQTNKPRQRVEKISNNESYDVSQSKSWPQQWMRILLQALGSYSSSKFPSTACSATHSVPMVLLAVQICEENSLMNL